MLFLALDEGMFFDNLWNKGGMNTEVSTTNGKEKRLAEKVDDFIRTQRRRVAYQLSILSIAKNNWIKIPADFVSNKDDEKDIGKITTVRLIIP